MGDEQWREWIRPTSACRCSSRKRCDKPAPRARRVAQSLWKQCRSSRAEGQSFDCTVEMSLLMFSIRLVQMVTSLSARTGTGAAPALPSGSAMGNALISPPAGRTIYLPSVLTVAGLARSLCTVQPFALSLPKLISQIAITTATITRGLSLSHILVYLSSRMTTTSLARLSALGAGEGRKIRCV